MPYLTRLTSGVFGVEAIYREFPRALNVAQRHKIAGASQGVHAVQRFAEMRHLMLTNGASIKDLKVLEYRYDQIHAFINALEGMKYKSSHS